MISKTCIYHRTNVSTLSNPAQAKEKSIAWGFDTWELVKLEGEEWRQEAISVL